MRTVRGPSGKRYLLVKRSNESSRIRDPETGTERYLPNADLELVEGRSPLETAAAGVSTPVRRVLTAVHTEQALGLLVELVDRGPLSVAALLDGYDLCESDLHGLLGEFRAAGLVEQREVHGERGYGPTDLAVEGVSKLRG
jgi:hypothetical protein